MVVRNKKPTREDITRAFKELGTESEKPVGAKALTRKGIKTQTDRTKENGNITGRKSRASWNGVRKRIREGGPQAGEAPEGLRHPCE